MYNLLIGGKAGQGIDTAAATLEMLLKRAGYCVFTSRDFMSRVRGGHNFSLLRFGTKNIRSHSSVLDGIIALDEETIEIHQGQLKEDGFILCDESFATDSVQTIKIPMNDIAKEIGNPRVSGSIGIGVIMKLFSENLDNAEDVFRMFLADKYININLQAIEEGYKRVESRYPHIDGDCQDDMILSGCKAIALGALAAGVKVYAAYPMSPSTSIMVYLAEHADESNIVVEQAEDEIAAMNMVIGASYAGVRAMTGTSGGGFALMVEALGLAGIAEIPLVVVDVQRPGPATGLPTRTEQGDLQFVISAAQGEFPRMVIAPRHHEDAFYQTIRAFNLAEKYQIPVIILADQFIGDASATVKPFDIINIEKIRPAEENPYEGEYLRYKYTESGISPRLVPGKTTELVLADSDEHDERGWITESAEVRIKMADKRMRKIESLKEELQEPEFIGSETFDTLLIGWGSTYGSVVEAIEILNKEADHTYAALMFADVFPLPTKLLNEKSIQADTIINVEQNSTGQFARLVREYTGIVCMQSVLKYDGRQISADEIVAKIKEVI